VENIELASFLGSAQFVDSKLLPPTVGVASTNQRPGRGDLQPWRQPLQVATVPTSPQRKTVYQMAGGYWFSWTTVVHATKGFDNDDTTERFYFTGSGTPKWTNNVIGLAGGPPYPQATRELAVPAPTTVLTTTVFTAGSAAAVEMQYVQTFVNDLGWESAPGPISGILSTASDSVVHVGNLDNAPAGAYGITLTRVYKAITDSSGTSALQYHSEHAIGTTTITDSGEALQEQLATGGNGVGSSWLPPPATGHGLVRMWNGMLAMFVGKTVYVCEPFEPYAYPARYNIDVADNIVALAVYGQQMLVLTDGDVYLVTGQDPASLDCTPQLVKQSCVAELSVVAFEDCVVWACPAGLWYFGARGSFLLTKDVLDAKQWSALAPSTMQCGRHVDLRLIFSFYNNGAAAGFCIDLDQPAGLYGIDVGYDALYRATTGKLHGLAGGSVREWDGGALLMTTTFRSKLFQQPAAGIMSAFEVIAAAWPVHVKLWGTTDSGTVVTLVDRDVTLADGGRPASARCSQYQVELSTSVGSVQAFRLAEDSEDLRRG